MLINKWLVISSFNISIVNRTWIMTKNVFVMFYNDLMLLVFVNIRDILACCPLSFGAGNFLFSLLFMIKLICPVFASQYVMAMSPYLIFGEAG